MGALGSEGVSLGSSLADLRSARCPAVARIRPQEDRRSQSRECSLIREGMIMNLFEGLEEKSEEHITGTEPSDQEPLIRDSDHQERGNHRAMENHRKGERSPVEYGALVMDRQQSVTLNMRVTQFCAPGVPCSWGSVLWISSVDLSSFSSKLLSCRRPPPTLLPWFGLMERCIMGRGAVKALSYRSLLLISPSDLTRTRPLCNVDVGNEDVGNEDVGNEDITNEVVGNEDVGNEDVGNEDITNEVVGNEDIGNEVVGNEDVGNEDITNEVVGNEDVGNEDVGNEDITNEVVGNEDVGNEDVGNEDITNEVVGNEVVGNKDVSNKDVSNEDVRRSLAGGAMPAGPAASGSMTPDMETLGPHRAGSGVMQPSIKGSVPPPPPEIKSLEPQED
ncbi:unnamed protein product [Boreogadus saida]